VLPVLRPLVVRGMLLYERLRSGATYFPLTEAFFQDPYPAYARLRAKDPVHWSPLARRWVVSRYAEVDAVLLMHPAVADVATVGVPQGRSGLFSQNTGPHAAQLQVYLTTPDRRQRNDRDIVAAIRPRLGGQFPGTTYQVQFGGIVSRVLNFGAQQAIEVEQLGYELGEARTVAQDVVKAMQETAGITDVFVSREENYPQFDIVVDREKAATAGVSQRDIAQAALVSLNSNISVNPSVFTDPRTGNQYNAVVQLDEEFRARAEDLGRIFVIGDGGRP